MQDRIQIEKEEESLTITIKAFFDAKKQQLLLVWILLFSVCGIAIISQFFENYDSGTKVFFGVYVAFWLFFEFKVIYAYRWRKYGVEKLIIEKESLYLIKTIGKRGVTQNIKKEEIKKIDFFKDQKGNFAKAMTTSYWNINKYRLGLFLENETVPFAIDVDQKDAKHLLNTIRNEM